MPIPQKTIKVIDSRKAGQQIRQMRLDAGKTVTAVANAMGITKGYLSDLELGKRAMDEQKYAAAVRVIRGGGK